MAGKGKGKKKYKGKYAIPSSEDEDPQIRQPRPTIPLVHTRTQAPTLVQDTAQTSNQPVLDLQAAADAGEGSALDAYLADLGSDGTAYMSVEDVEPARRMDETVEVDGRRDVFKNMRQLPFFRTNLSSSASSVAAASTKSAKSYVGEPVKSSIIDDINKKIQNVDLDQLIDTRMEDYNAATEAYKSLIFNGGRGKGRPSAKLNALSLNGRLDQNGYLLQPMEGPLQDWDRIINSRRIVIDNGSRSVRPIYGH